MRILITGGAGFIGSNLIHHWLKEHPQDFIVNFDSLTYAGNLANLRGCQDQQNYQFFKGDLCKVEDIRTAFQRYAIDSVIHLAAESHVDRSITGPGAFIQTNVVGTFNLLEVTREFWRDDFSHRRFHHVSTDEVYGSLGPEGLFKENSPYAPNSPYSASKAGSDHLVRAYHHTYGLNAVTTNCSNNYGPFQFPEKLIPLLIKNCLERKPIPVYGDGKNVRDWLYVKDHCQAIDLVFHQGKTGECYNIGGHNEWQNIQIVKHVCARLDELLGHQAEKSCANLITYVKDRPGHDRRYAIDATKIKEELNWQPQYPFEQGIEETLKWYMNNQNWVDLVTSGEYLDYYTKQYAHK